MTYVRFEQPRRLVEYRGQSGSEVGGLRLSPMALDEIAAAATEHREPGLVVIGETVNPDSRYLDYGVTRTFIESTTNFRQTRGSGFLWTCPDCGLLSGKHSKVCGYGA